MFGVQEGAALVFRIHRLVTNLVSASKRPLTVSPELVLGRLLAESKVYPTYLLEAIEEEYADFDSKPQNLQDTLVGLGEEIPTHLQNLVIQFTNAEDSISENIATLGKTSARVFF